jgi:hypothetical protein
METPKLEEIMEHLIEVITEIGYYQGKPTKASSGRIRKELGAIKKLVTDVRKELVLADHKGY